MFDSLFEGKGVQAGMCPSLSSQLQVHLEKKMGKNNSLLQERSQGKG